MKTSSAALILHTRSTWHHERVFIDFFAVTLYEKIHELEEKKQSLVDEASSKGTPAEEREKLLKQV